MRLNSIVRLLLRLPLAAALVYGQYIIEKYHPTGLEYLIGIFLATDRTSHKFVAQSEWTAEFEFRATGPERGGGNLQIWYTKEGRPQAETPSIYTTGAFDGLALVIDMYGGKVGDPASVINPMLIRENIGHHAVESLAFGHCDFSYRNLGRPSRVQIKHLAESFEVLVDGRRCFSSDKIRLPSGYYFGISAASADTPDSFEVYKFVASAAPGITRELPRRDPPGQQAPPASNPGAATNDQGSRGASADAQVAGQFTDLQNRLQTLSQSLDNIFREVQQLATKSEARHQDLSHKFMSGEQLNAMDARIRNIENTLQGYSGQFSNIQSSLKDSHSTLNEGLTQQMTHIISTKSPKMSSFVIVVVVFQLLLAGSYVIYKRRRANGPKKYL
ncbi:MAG: hypothetical protein L6R40_002228 [Gallowayella cf. fulva]|nr:MAG: hypothetical protein L6R40_002228 [Xanthomendoza cf. fulva]